MYMLAETKSFQVQAAKIWTDAECMDFLAYLAQNPLEGDVITNGDGLRKIRWHRAGKGKRGGTRVIYYNLLDEGIILLLAVYAKNIKETITQNELKTLKGNRDE